MVLVCQYDISDERKTKLVFSLLQLLERFCRVVIRMNQFSSDMYSLFLSCRLLCLFVEGILLFRVTLAVSLLLGHLCLLNSIGKVLCKRMRALLMAIVN